MTDQDPKQAFESKFRKDEKEVLVLFSDASGAAAKTGRDLWNGIAYFLAYVDVATNEFKPGEGAAVWLMTEKEKGGQDYFHRFQKGGIYRLRVRELMDKTVSPGMAPSYFNRLLVAETLEENVPNDALRATLEEYRKPVVISDPALGEFKLNKDFKQFDGKIDWLGKKVYVLLDVNLDDKATWTEAMEILKKLSEEQTRWDAEFRAFAAEKLTELANDWAEEGVAAITKHDFVVRLSLSELSIRSDGNFTAYYDDDDMFYGHAVTVYGSIKNGLKSANIEG